MALLDDFNRADGAPGTSWSSPSLPTFGAYSIVSNELGGGSTFLSSYWNTIFGADQEARAIIEVVPSSGDAAMLLCRIQNPDTGSFQHYELLLDGVGGGLAQLHIQKNIATTITHLQNTGVTVAAGDQVALSVIGTTLRAYKNGVQAGTDQTDSSISGAGYIGLAHRNTTVVKWDDFGGGSIGLGYQRVYGPAHLGTSPATLYTVPAGVRARIRHVYVNNPSGLPVDFTLSIGADAASTRLYDSYNVPSDDSIYRVHDNALEAGETIQAYAGTDATLVITLDVYIEAIG